MDQRADWPCSHVVARSLANKGESVLLVEAFATDIYLRARISTKRASRAWCARAYITLHTHTWSNTTWWTERHWRTKKERAIRSVVIISKRKSLPIYLLHTLPNFFAINSFAQNSEFIFLHFFYFHAQIFFSLKSL